MPLVQIKCSLCNKKFWRLSKYAKRKYKNKFCSVLCRNKWICLKRKEASITEFTCIHCKKVVKIPKWVKYSHAKLRKYCSVECRHLHNTDTIICALCNKKQIRPKCTIRKGRNHFCCKAHRYKFRNLSTNSQGPDSQGYIWVRINGGPRQMQHRIIMEKKLKRPLRNDEKIHHKNGQKKDNRLENLELWSTGHPSGQRVIDKIKWAKEFLKLYGFTIKETV